MGAPPRLRGLPQEDFRDAPKEMAPIFERLLGSLNPHIRQTTDLFNHGLTLRENVVCMFQEAVVTAPGWLTVADSGTTDPYLKNSWVYLGDPQYFLPRVWLDDSGTVHSLGLIASGTATAGTTMFTLPANYWPERATLVPAVSNDAFAQFRVQADGDVAIHTGSANWFSLDGGRWPAYLPNGLPPFSGSGWPIIIDTLLPLRPSVCLLAKAEDTGGKALSHAAGAIDWTLDGRGRVVVRRVAGLLPGRTYKLTFLCFGG